MQPQDAELVSGYGEAMLYSHLIEDLLKLTIRHAARFGVNGYEGSKYPTRTLEGWIDEFGRAFPDSRPVVKRLHLLRKCRNKLTHALVTQVGSDMLTDEGKEQVLFAIRRFTGHAKGLHRFLGQLYPAILKKAAAQDLAKLFEGEAEEFDAHVASSDILRILDELDKPIDPIP